LRVLVAAGLTALAAGGCGGDTPAAKPQGGGEATVATVGACLAKAGARPAMTAAELRFAVRAVAGAVGAGLDGRTTYEFKPRDPGADWRVFRTRRSDQPKPVHAADPPAPGEEVAVLPPPATAAAIRRAQDCADGAPE
jgi:hypothetical protein